MPKLFSVLLAFACVCWAGCATQGSSQDAVAKIPSSQAFRVILNRCGWSPPSELMEKEPDPKDASQNPMHFPRIKAEFFLYPPLPSSMRPPHPDVLVEGALERPLSDGGDEPLNWVVRTPHVAKVQSLWMSLAFLFERDGEKLEFVLPSCRPLKVGRAAWEQLKTESRAALSLMDPEDVLQDFSTELEGEFYEMGRHDPFFVSCTVVALPVP